MIFLMFQCFQMIAIYFKNKNHTYLIKQLHIFFNIYIFLPGQKMEQHLNWILLDQCCFFFFLVST